MVARSFRLWEKKRGDRRTGSQFVGGVGEAIFFAVLFLIGALSLAYVVAAHFAVAPAHAYQPGFGFWVMVLVMVSFTLIGGGGVIYSVLQVGTSAERRSAMAQRAADMNPIQEGTAAQRDYPSIPRDANFTNSPGIRLAYRLPVTNAGTWVLFAATGFFLIWNSITTVLVFVAARSHLSQHPNWFLTAFTLPFIGIGLWASYYFVQQLLLHTGIGPTTLEISAHPLRPGQTYQLLLSQAGRLHVKSLDLLLVCDEETTYRQGTDIRTERCRVFSMPVLSVQDFRIEPDKAFEQSCELTMPGRIMHSFQAKQNAVQWMLVARGQATSWPAFQRCFPVVVYPADSQRGAD